jgi:chromosome segregation ATPase
MNIKSISINGFKSFGKKTTFDFRMPITAIVGPNGSGKSNITEAIRFVLGEQSFKSIRTKDSSDLLFRGSDSKANMLSISMLFSDTEKLAINAESILLKNALEKNEIEISRVLYIDGKNLYKINNQEVRLKDIQELLTLLGIGSKNNWHISQGESDKILLASPDSRREMIEDSLGLRIYHSKIDSSQKKLDKSNENIREANLKRREIAPEINLLSKQIEKIEKVQSYRQELLSKWGEFNFVKSKNLENLKSEFKSSESLTELEEKKINLDKMLAEIEKSHYQSGVLDKSVLENKKQSEQVLLEQIKSKQQQIVNQKRESENLLNYLKIEIDKNTLEIESVLKDLNLLTLSGNEILFKENDLLALKSKINNLKNQNTETLNISTYINNLEELSIEINSLLAKGVLVSKDNAKEISYLNNIKTRVEQKLSVLISERDEAMGGLDLVSPDLDKYNLQIEILTKNIENLHIEILEFKFKISEYERSVERQKSELSEIDRQIEKLNRTEYIIAAEEKVLDDSKYEIQKIFGQDFDLNQSMYVYEQNYNNKNHTNEEMHELERSIERLKIKIEDSQINNAEDISTNFKNLKDKDAYLSNEINDLEASIKNLQDLIADLKDRLKADFESGVSSIDTYFDTYIKKLFGGGSGRVYINVIDKKKKVKIGEEGEGESVNDNDEGIETDDVRVGLEVEIELPKKKVKGLQSLSGGERALVSIALTVAILQNNPSPFLVLDEADATLDEANAKRYGELLELIKEKTKLIVVTHNRETMSFADEVYGITLEKSGASKVLSVSFEDALGYAK